MSFAAPEPPAPRRRRAARIALVAVPALVVVAGVSSLVTLLVAGGHHAHPTAAAAHPSGSRHATVGTLAAEDGSSWTVRTAQGTSVSVKLGSRTAFGTRTDPSQASAFHTGSTVKVLGAVKGSTLDASRVVLVHGSASSGSTSGT